MLNDVNSSQKVACSNSANRAMPQWSANHTVRLLF